MMSFFLTGGQGGILISMQENLIEKTIKAHIAEQNAVFVFPTGISADRWADRATLTCGVSAVAMERFIAWDDFKTASIKSHVVGKKSVPSVMRTVFASNLIAENADAPFLKNLIVPQYAKNAASFADWISSLLPSLASWKKKFEARGTQADDEDSDLLLLHERYSAFLDAHNLFDPAWETPPFVPDGNDYYIFYPEVLMDFAEYKQLLTGQTQIHLVRLDNCTAAGGGDSFAKPTVDFFSNARSELRHVALHIRKLHEEEHIAWEDIAISVPDLATYAPYLTRELELYQIPHVLKMGLPLTTSGAGNFFVQLQNCVEQKFSFESVKNLLLNTELPWKEPSLNSELVQFGKDNNCICSYEYNGEHIDVWKQAFKSLHDRSNTRLEEYYDSLKKHVSSIVDAPTFADINASYFKFKPLFFDEDGFTLQTNNILSRCITELAALIDLERDFADCTVPSPYRFFTNILSGISYLAQTDARGAQIFPYKLAATAPFASHIVIDASQASVSILFKQLPFLRQDKRAALGLEDVNPSAAFIKLYTLSSLAASADDDSRSAAYFTVSEQTFSGYALPHSDLEPRDRRPGSKTEVIVPEEYDSYQAEKAWLLEDSSDAPARITALQQQGFTAWEQAHKGTFDSKANEMASCAGNALATALKQKVYNKDNGKIAASKTALNTFYSCPRLYVLQNVLAIQPEINEAELMDAFAVGNLNHAIMQFYCAALKEKNRTLHAENDALTDEYKQILSKAIDDAIAQSDNSPLAKELLLTERIALGEKMNDCVVAFSKWFEGCTVYAVEEPYTYAPEGKEYFFTGRPDCLLATSDGGIILIDFKTSKGGIPKDSFYVSEDVPVPDFQMPLYKLMLEHQAHPLPVETVVYYCINDSFAYVVEGSLVNPDNGKTIEGTDLTETITAVEKLTDSFADHIKAQQFAVDSKQQDFETCNECAYRAVCRRVYTVSGDKSLGEKS